MPPPSAESKANALPKPKRRLSTGRRWLFRCLAVACGILPFLILEFALWLCGFGHDLRLIIPVVGAPGWYQLNPRFDEQYYGKSDLAGPETRPFRLPKPAGVQRILVVGGSTVIGFPYSPELAFPRQLEVLLQHAGTAGASFEILNAGITALNSTTDVAVVDEGLACDPDLIVLYTGHNEFYGPGGAAAAGGGLSPKWFRSLSAWRRLRIVQALHRLRSVARPPTKTLIEQFATDLRVSEESPVYRTVMERLEENLETLVAVAQRKSVPVILVSPVSNERHQPPIEPALPKVKEREEPAWRDVLRKAEHFLRFDQPEQALALLESIESEAGCIAVVQFRLAQARDRTGNLALAASHYRRARDLDGGRFRAPSAFRDVFRRVTEHHADQGVMFLDLQPELLREEPSGTLGRKHFLEHVHFNWEGNAAVARILAKFMQERVLTSVMTPRQDLDSERIAEWLRVQPEDHLAAGILSMMVYETPPFRDATDATLLEKRFAADTMSRFQQLSAPRRAIFEDLTTDAMAFDTLSALIRRARDFGQDEEVGVLLEAMVQRRPWLCSARSEYIAWLEQHRKSHEAEELRRDAGRWPCLPAAKSGRQR